MKDTTSATLTMDPDSNVQPENQEISVGAAKEALSMLLYVTFN